MNRIYAPSSADHKNLVDCYKKMKGDILNYYKIPAGATTAVRTAPTYELKYNTSTKKYEGTIKADSSISQFDFSKVDGVTFKKTEVTSRFPPMKTSRQEQKLLL